MQIKTADLWDQFEDEVQVAEPVFRSFGGRNSFWGKAVCLQVFEDNVLVRRELETDGTGKVLVVETGKRLSLQLHRVKDETIYVASGKLRLHLENDRGEVVTRDMGPGEHSRIPVGRRHRFEAIEHVEIIEVSTPELDDVVRIEDDHGRV